MKHLKLAVLVTVLLLLSLSALLIVTWQRTTDAPANIYKDAAASVVKIVMPDSHGSGVIVHEDGLILTNRHVVEDAEKLTVVLYSKGDAMPAELLWVSSANYDLALLKVQAAHPLPKATLRTTPLQLGEPVFAIGHPGRFEWSVSFGHVSNLTSPAIANIKGLIQLDLDINPGNSGGGLFDMQGRLVGLPNLFARVPAGFEVFDTNISFAVSAETICEMTLGCR